MKYLLSNVILCVALVAVTGCSNEAQEKVALRRSNLTVLGSGYLDHISAKGSAPTDVEDFSEFLLEKSPDDSAVSDAVVSLREGDVVMLWNGVLSETEDNDLYTLGFEASVPGSGGYIVTAGGSVELVTASQFAARPQVEQAEAVPAKEPETKEPQAEPESEEPVATDQAGQPQPDEAPAKGEAQSPPGENGKE